MVYYTPVTTKEDSMMRVRGPEELNPQLVKRAHEKLVNR